MDKNGIPPRRGRPRLKWPDQIPDTPENVARAIMQGPPKKEWQFLKERASKNPKRKLQSLHQT